MVLKFCQKTKILLEKIIVKGEGNTKYRAVTWQAMHSLSFQEQAINYSFNYISNIAKY